MKKIVLAAAFAAAFAASAMAQSDSSIPPRDPPFGKGNPGNDTMHEPNSAGSGPSESSPDQIPQRDPPFGRGNAGNDTMHLPSSTLTQGKAGDSAAKGEPQKSAKKDARTKSVMKKDTKGGAKPDAAPKSDTD